MKIDIDGIQAFVLVADTGGFGRAASQLHLTQTALTRRIQKLEAYLGVRLLDRTTRSVRLTAVGRDFLPQARRLVGELTFTVSQVRDQSRLARGDIAIACIPTMAHHALPSVIHEYAERHPGNRIRILESTAAEVSRAVLQDRADFGITLELERHPELVAQTLLQEPFMFFCRTEHPLARQKSVQWKELREAELIMLGGQSGNRALLDHQLARNRISLRGAYEVEHLATAIGLVTAGVGTAILPFSTIQEGTNPLVRRLPLVAPVVRRTVIVIQRRGATLSPPAAAFHALLARHLPQAARAFVRPRRATGSR